MANLYKASAFTRVGGASGFSRTIDVYASAPSMASGVLEAERAAVRWAKREYFWQPVELVHVEIQTIELLAADWQ